MSHKVFHGFVWYAYPDVFGLDDERPPDPGHPFAAPSGEVRTPDEVLYYRPAQPADAGVRNPHRASSYLILSKTQFHPRLGNGWESEPAGLTDGFKTEDGKVRMVRIVQTHHRHAGDLIECELMVND